jgi:NSS family neurotransmitter:Na+ symporter
LAYYAVVAGWCLKFIQESATGGMTSLFGENAEKAFVLFANSKTPVIYQFISIGTGALIVLKGVTGGIEKANKIIIPLLFLLLAMAVIKTITLPGAFDGFAFMFHFNVKDFANANVWLDGMSQSAWSTGAGWGLVLTYGVYVKNKENIVQNAILTGIGNNFASIMAASAIIPAVFALGPLVISGDTLSRMGGISGLLQSGGPASTGLTFIWIPALFKQMPGGALFTILFFTTLFFAALSSLIAMVELGTRVFMDMGISRSRATVIIAISAFLMGIPSAVNLNFFQNQDWVWGVGLMLSGLFVAITVAVYGPLKFRTDFFTKTESKIPAPLFSFWIYVAIPLQFLIMVGWWFKQSVKWDPDWLNPFGTFTIGTTLVQWLAVFAIILVFNKFITKKNLSG